MRAIGSVPGAPVGRGRAFRLLGPLRLLAPCALAAGLLAAGPAAAQLFTHPPTDAANVAGVEPRGGLNGSTHVLAVDHFYLNYPNPFNGGADTYPVYAMGAAEIVMLLREFPDDIPDPDYDLYLRHSQHVTVQYDHLHGLAPEVLAHVESIPEAWIPIGDDAEILLLGQGDAPAPLPVAAGQEIGFTRSYFESWDLGVIDRRVRGGRFARRGLRRYPSLVALLELAGVPFETAPFPGHPTLNSACFLRYMGLPLRLVWTAKLLGPPGFCGRAGWDLRARLRGAWFNPAVDAAEPPPLFELEQAALSVIPDNLDPWNTVQIAIGSGSPFSGIDPAGALPQLEQEFRVTMDSTPGARIDPNPARVTRKTGTVCYNLYHETGGMPQYNLLFLRLRTPNRLLARFDDTPYTFPACVAFLDGDPQPWDAVYVR